MAETHPENIGGGGVRSTAHILGHPVHPMLIPFPIAFLIGGTLTDIAYVSTLDEFWGRASIWLIASGFVTGLAAALAGLIDFMTIRRARAHLSGWIHLIGNTAALGLALINWLARVSDPASFIQPWGLVLSLVITALLAVTGWTGGELSYRHQIGVSGH